MVAADQTDLAVEGPADEILVLPSEVRVNGLSVFYGNFEVVNARPAGYQPLVDATKNAIDLGGAQQEMPVRSASRETRPSHSEMSR